MQPMPQPMPFPDIHPAFFVIFAVGVLVSLVATIWFLVVGFQEHIAWGLGMLFFGSLVEFVFLLAQFKKAWKPALLRLTGVALVGVALIAFVVKLNEVQTTAAEQNVPAPPKRVDPLDPAAADAIPATERRITLTGATREEYAKLGKTKAWAFIQWANADVTDDDLEALHGMTELRELDLSGTQVTDDGLHAVEDCEKLEVLRLARTAITEEGFREHVEPIETLMTLDIRGTKIPKKVGVEWKAARAGRKLLQ